MPLKETLILRVILFKNVKNKTGKLCCPTALILYQTSQSGALRPESPPLGVQKHQGGAGFRLLHSKRKKKKITNLKSQSPKGKKKNHFIDLPTTMVSESPRWGLEWTKLLRLGWGGSFGWWVGGEGRPATGPKKVSLCNKTSLDNKQNEKQKDQWQASSWRLLVRLAVGRLSPL